MKKNNNNINIKLQNIRKNNKMSYEQVAKKLNISKAYYWQIENGNRRLYYDLALKIAKVFSKKPDEIFYDYYNKK